MALPLASALAGVVALYLRSSSNGEVKCHSGIPSPPEKPARCGVVPWGKSVGNPSSCDCRSLLPRDAWFIRKCRDMVKTNIAPIHSGLLVCAVISFVDVNGRRKFTVGQNGEPCVIAGSLCAERGALMKYAK